MSRSKFVPALWVSLALVAAAQAGQNQSPFAPTILEPTGARLLDGADVHMECAPFADPDAGDTHICSDWEIVDVAWNELVWLAGCATGSSRVHIHLGDGAFVGTLTGSHALSAGRVYKVRVRHKDSSNDSPTEWSPWSERTFETGTASTITALELTDMKDTPVARVQDAISGADFPLPLGSSVSTSLEFGTVEGDQFLVVRGGLPRNSVINSPPISHHHPVRIHVRAGDGPANLPALDLVYFDDEAKRRTIFLPAMNLATGQEAYYWVSTNGSTFHANPSQTEPNLSQIARASTAPWDVPADFRVNRVATGFQLPSSIEFVPTPPSSNSDPYYYVGELYGTIKAVTRTGAVSTFASNLLNFNPTGDFPGSGEMGIGDIAVDPATGTMYATIVLSDVNGDDSAPKRNRVIKLTSSDGGRTASSVTTILNMTGVESAASHQVSHISFGPDGYLYVHTGDGLVPQSAQDVNDWRGKVLRMTTTGQPVSSNPFYNAGDGINAKDYVYALGLRNPFGGEWRSSDQTHFIIENGPGVDRLSRLVAGRNYLYDSTDESMFQYAIYNWNPAVAPVTGAVLQQSRFGRSGFPEVYQDRLYVTCSGPTWADGPSSNRWKSIEEFVIDANGNLQSNPRTIAAYSGPGKSTVAAIAAGPDGLYFSDLYAEFDLNNPIAHGANIFRLSYQAPQDCNGNGLDDVEDILAGRASDCNRNLVPDSCDLAYALSVDCNLNNRPDECDTIRADFYPFNTSASPFTPSGNAVYAGATLSLTPGSGNSQGTFVAPPVSVQALDYERFQFEFAITGTGTEGIGYYMLDADVYSQFADFNADGPGFGSVGIKLDPTDPTGTYPALVELRSQGITIATAGLPFAINDGVFRVVRFVRLGTGVTVRVASSTGTFYDALVNVQVPGFVAMRARHGLGASRTGSGNQTHRVDNVFFHVPAINDVDGDWIPNSCECADIDFNQDGLYPDTADIDDLIRVFGGGACSTGHCNSIDFNGDGQYPDTRDIDAFLSVFSGGPCL